MDILRESLLKSRITVVQFNGGGTDSRVFERMHVQKLRSLVYSVQEIVLFKVRLISAFLVVARGARLNALALIVWAFLKDPGGEIRIY